MQRRVFLKLFGGAAAANVGVRLANVSTTPVPTSVDFHCHAILPSFVDGLRQLGIDAAYEEGFPLPKWNVEDHLKFMEEAGIDFSILSPPSPHIASKNRALARRVVRKFNEETAELCRAYPQKFGFVSAAPLPDVEGALEETRYAREELGALGVKVASNSLGVYLGDPALDPFFAELNQRETLVITHPSPARSLPRDSVVTGRVMALFEYPADTTRAALNMIANGTLVKFEKLRFVIPHVGSFLPYMKQRATGMFKLLATLNMIEPVDVEQALARLYFDLAGDPTADALDMLLAITDLDHIVYGSDYPYSVAPVLLPKKRALDSELAERACVNSIYQVTPNALLQH